MYYKETPKVNINTMKVIQEVLEKLNTHKVLRQRQVPLFMSKPGYGKTSLIYEFAKKYDKKVIEIITSTKNPMEISGIAMPDKDSKKMSIWDFDLLLGLKDGDILFFDELLNGNPATLNACLTLLENRRMMSGKDLPDIIIVAAANYEGMAQITPQIKERFVWYDLKFDELMWQKYLEDKYRDVPEIVSKKLIELVKKEDFKGYNYMTPRSIDKAIEAIIYDMPTPYSKDLNTILNSSIVNKLDGDIQLPNGEIWSKGESIEWLKLKQYEYGVIS
jgi:hypothetical protein